MQGSSHKPGADSKRNVVPESGIRGAGGRLSAPHTEVSGVVRVPTHCLKARD